MRALFVGCCLVGIGCAEAPAPSSEDGEVVLITSITALGAEGATSPGFDLDGEVTPAGGGPCGVGDLVAPDGTPGIDNAFSALMPALLATEAMVAETLLNEAIKAGELLLLVRAVDGRVEAVNGVGDVLLGTDGSVLPYQTFEIDPVAPPVPAARAVLDADVMEGRELPLRFPMQILDAALDVTLHRGAVRLERGEDDVWRGLVAGAMDGLDVYDQLDESPLDPLVFALLQSGIDANADLDLDGDGRCEGVTMTFAVEAEPAFLY